MKKTLPFLIVAVVGFLAVLAFLAFWHEEDSADAFGRSDGPFQVKSRDPIDFAEPSRHRSRPSSVTVEPAESVSADTGRGSLVVTVRTMGGSRPDVLKARIDPAGEASDTLKDGFRWDDLKAGNYAVTVYGGDYVPVTRPGIPVEAGRLTRLEIPMVLGKHVRGRVVDALDKRPVPGAVVDFGGAVRVTTDASGRFEVDPLLSKRTLRRITITHPDYDRQVYRDMLISDTQELELPLGGGLGQIVGEVVNRSGRPLPNRYEVRVTIEPLYQTRRSIWLEGGAARFRFDHVYVTRYRVELHFPNGEFPTQYQYVELTGDEPAQTMRFVLEKGTTLSGQCLGPKNVVAGLRIELRNLRNEVVAETRSDAEGGYAFLGLAEGRYFPVVNAGGNLLHLKALTLNGRDDVRRDIDVLRGRFVER